MRVIIIVTAGLLVFCGLFGIFQYGQYLRRFRFDATVTADFEEDVHYGSLFRHGLTLRRPSLHKYPSFNIGSLEGTYIPFSKVECGKDVLKPGHKIPNIVHYVWFGKFKINILQYYAMRSAALIQKPRMIIFHMDEDEPIGPYWERLKEEIPCIRIVNLKPPDKVWHRHVKLVEHKSDVARMNILLKYGGIYSDVNVMFVRPMDELMKYSAVLGKEEDRSYGNSFILSERNSSFMQIWLESYINFDYTRWSDHSTAMPRKLHEQFPELELHVEQYSMMRPNYVDGSDWLFYNNWDLRYNYCVHLYVNVPDAKASLKSILELPESDLVTMDNTFGQLIRISLFGTPYFMVDELDTQLMKAHSSIHCSSNVIQQSNDEIPNVLHYVWNGDEIRYHHYLAVRSTIETLKPQAVYIHVLTGSDPFHYGYLLMLREIECLHIVDASHLHSLVMNSVSPHHLQKLIPGLHVLYKHGGILMDFNTTIFGTNALKDLMLNDFIIGKSAEEDFEYSMIMSKPQSEYLFEWMNLLQNISSLDDIENSLNRALQN
uniref:uncharacterized protein LOC120330834 n=1 Tax=Styela clava TaxID=7725 RepID=UPI001939DD20|nr:uncharacterized protein LOC120330834 [Styela clava]